MAYTVAWDESTPDGDLVAASDIDQELQDLKTSLRERLEQVIPDFGDDGVDPKVIPIPENDFWIGESPTGESTSSPLTNIFTLAEQAQSGIFTVVGDNVQIDEDGTYLALFNSSIAMSDGSASMFLLSAGATIVGASSAGADFRSAPDSTTATITGFAIVTATSGDQVYLQADMVPDTGNVTMRPQLVLIKLV